jgi:error-prone DNA polymerase
MEGECGLAGCARRCTTWTKKPHTSPPTIWLPRGLSSSAFSNLWLCLLINLALVRPLLAERRLACAADLQDVANGATVSYCGLVTLRQQPDTAKGVIFVSLEDETGVVQVIAWKHIRVRQRNELLNARLLAVHGTWQRKGAVCSLVAQRLEDLTALLGRLATESRDFR